MSPRPVDEGIERGDRGGADGPDTSLAAAVADRWYLWVAAAAAVALAAVAFTRQLSGPLDEALFGVIAVALVVTAVLRPVQVALD